MASLGVRLGRNGRVAWADYQKPLGGLHGGFCSKYDNVRILYGRFSKYKQNQGVGECDHFLRLFDYAITCSKDAARE